MVLETFEKARITFTYSFLLTYWSVQLYALKNKCVVCGAIYTSILVIYAPRDLDQWEKVYDLFYVYLLTKSSDTILADHYHTANMELLLDLKPQLLCNASYTFLHF